jgi:hypothetical protein
MKKQKTSVQDPAADLVADMLEKAIEVDGREMTVREAMLRAIYRKSLGGDISASVELQDLRDRCGVTDGSERVGCLVVPEPIDLEEFSRLAFEQQRPFREG